MVKDKKPVMKFNDGSFIEKRNKENEQKRSKEWMVVVSEKANEQLKAMPDGARQEMEQIMEGFVSGELDPMEIGKPMDMHELIDKLRCADCDSLNIDWQMDVGNDEAYYNCSNCGGQGWMTRKEFEKAKKNNPDLLFK